AVIKEVEAVVTAAKDEINYITFSGSGEPTLHSSLGKIIRDLKKLNEIGAIEFLSESYSHSILSKKFQHEFMHQTLNQKNKILKLFGQIPKTFVNNYGYPLQFLSDTLPKMGIKGLLQFEDIQYKTCSSPTNYMRLSESDSLQVLNSDKWVLQPFIEENNGVKSINMDAFLNWVKEIPDENEVIYIALDYTELHSRNSEDVGILEFIKALPENTASKNIGFCTPSEMVSGKSGKMAEKPIIAMETKKELGARAINGFQKEIIDILISLKEKVYQTKDEKVLKTWFYLQDQWLLNSLQTDETSDAEKNQAVQSYINFRNILEDFTKNIEKTLAKEKSTPIELMYDKRIKSLGKGLTTDSWEFNSLF
ncbi:alpha-glycosidase, partial [Cecembia sp.]|uniref:alpha-glycosidase n=1 Tax=Cecembia sp. TaxID=1898110 RepID=UPI0025BDCCB1